MLGSRVTSDQTSAAFATARASSRRSLTVVAVAAAVLAALTVSACGSGSEQNAGEPHAYFPVQVTSAVVPVQKLGERTKFTVSVRNAGSKTIPDVAVTITNPDYGDAAQSFGYLLPQPGPGQPLLASRSRPVWIVMQNPGACSYSCKHLGPGGAATAYTDTWALGVLKPGQTAAFQWTLEAVKAGSWKIEYQVAAGLNGYAKTELTGAADHTPATGTLKATITTTPQSLTVAKNGTVTAS